MPRVPVCFAAAVLLLSSAAAQAARVERVEIVGLDEEMTENVRVSLALYESIGRDISGRRMAYLLREAERETRKALEPFGYYSPTIDVQRDREGDVMSVRVVVDPGQPVRVRNSDIAIIGHAIECRINAENPQTFRPSPGRITQFHPPGGLGVRIDSAVYQGYVIPPYYDSLVGKLIVHGKTRGECLMRLRRALDEMVVDGIETTLPLFRALVREPDIIEGDYHIHWLEQYLAGQPSDAPK